MKTTTLMLAATTALTVPAAASAATVTLTTALKSYNGEGAYLAYYLTDATGNYVRTLHISGGKAKYYNHLQGWFSLTGGNSAEIAGLTGASVGAGRSETVTVEIEDALINAGYQIRVDSSVEHQADVPFDAYVTLDSASAGQPVAGRGYIASFTFDM